MADGPKKFGRYFLLDLLAQGGMAEIYRARLASTDGAGRLIVIKRIQAGHGSDQEFLKMFRSEIKVTMGFNHPNIAQLYDFGEEQDQPYIAMEWVDGKNLRQFMARFIDLKQKFPIDLAVQVIEQAACGLHYAHNFKDKISGTPLNVIHRDISPQNLLISYEGSVKVIDFGIAKADVNAEATRAGVIKGKPSYLSPEQINGDVLDGRSDIFSLGTVLWELLAGRKLFSGETDLAILKQIESCNTFVKPPSTINPDVPPELDYIVLRSLAKQRDKRYQSAEEFQRALHKFLYTHSPEFNPADLAYYAKDLFKNEIVEDRKKIQRLNDEVERLMSSVVMSNAPLTLENSGKISLETQEGNDTTVVATKAKPTFTVFENDPTSVASSIEVSKSQTFSSARHRSVTNSSGNIFAGHERGTSATATYRVRNPSPAKAESNNFKIFAGAAAVLLVAGVGLFFGRDYLEGVPTLTPSSTAVRNLSSEGNAPAPIDQPSKIEPSHQGKSILLKLKLAPGGGSPVIKLNGQNIDPEKPEIKVPLDTSLELSVERKDYKPFTRQFYIESAKIGDLGQWLMDVQLEPVRYGTLYINTTPSAEAMIMMEGKPWVKNTPFDKEIMLPVGTYLVQLNNRGLGMGKTLKVVIEEGKVLRLDDIHLEVMDK